MSIRDLDDLQKELQLLSFKENKDLKEMLFEIKDIIIKFERPLRDLLTKSQSGKLGDDYVKEKNFLEFLLKIEPEQFFIGSLGHDFEYKFKKIFFLDKKRPYIKFIRALFEFIEELILFSSSKICPICSADQLVIYVRKINSKKIIEYCPSCFYAQPEDGEIGFLEQYIPANIKILKEKGYI